MEFTRERLFSMLTGYQASAVLRAAIELCVFDVLAEQATEPGYLAYRLGTDPRGTEALLAALSGLGLVIAADGTYTLAPGTRELLVSTEPGYAGGAAKVAASELEWDALGTLAATVRLGYPAGGRDSLTPDFPYWVDFATHTTFATDRLAALIADVLGAPESTWDVLDVGCGHGLIGYEVAARHPGAHIWSQDWPSVLAVAEQHAKRLGVEGQVTPLPGDAFDVPLERDYDVIIVANLLFHFSAARAHTLLERLSGALAPGGKLVIAGFTAGDQPAATELRSRLLDLLMLSTTPDGQVHDTAAYLDMLAACGLTATETHTRPPLPHRVLVATRTAEGSTRDVE